MEPREEQQSVSDREARGRIAPTATGNPATTTRREQHE
jgi:hypothetical protein